MRSDLGEADLKQKLANRVLRSSNGQRRPLGRLVWRPVDDKELTARNQQAQRLAIRRRGVRQLVMEVDHRDQLRRPIGQGDRVFIGEQWHEAP